MNLDLKKFKKVDCDDKCTTLMHDNGHQLIIAHKNLTGKLKKELDELPVSKGFGGPINTKSSSHNRGNQVYKQIPGHGVGPEPAMNSKPSPPSKQQAETAYTEPEDQVGNDVVLKNLNKTSAPFSMASNEKQQYPPCINPSCKSYGRSHPNCRCYGGLSETTGAGNTGYFAKGGEVDSYCSTDRPHQKACEYFADGGEAAPEVNLSSVDVNPDAQIALKPEFAATTHADPEAEQTQEPAPDQAQMPETSGAQSAPTMEEPEPLATTEVNAPAPEQEQAPAQKFQAHKQNDLNQMGQEYQTYVNDVNAGHIKPETYSDLFNKKDTLGKIGTLFGLLIGGAGSGLAHQPNMIMEMMNNEIERDLKAQQESAGNKMNFLKINQQNLLNNANTKNVTAEANTKSYALSRMQMNYAALHKLVVDTQKLPPGSPQRAQAEQTLAMMNQGIQNENFGIADRAASASALGKMLNGGSASPQNTTLLKSGIAGPEAKEVGEDVEQKTIPGISGKAQRPIQQADRDKVVAMKVLSDKARDVLDFAQQHKGTLSPAMRKQGEQKAAELVNFYNSSLGGALTGYKLPWLEGQIGKNPTSVFQDILGNNAKLREIKTSNDTRMGTLLQSYGMQGPKASAQSAPQEKVSKSGRAMTQKNGKWVYK